MTAPTTIGTYQLVGVYSGDSNYTGSTSASVPITVPQNPVNVVLTANYTTVPPGAAVVLTATVTPTIAPSASAEQHPTGNVIFYNGTTVLGEVPLVPTPLTDFSTAIFTTQTLPGGQDTISAYYSGDNYFSWATSNLLTLTVQAFTITPSPYNPPTNLNIVQGGAGSEAFIIGGQGGFDNEIQVICTVPTQDDMTCTASPQQVYPTATVTFVVQTYVTGGPEYAVKLRKPNSPWPGAAGGAALAALVFFLLPFGRRARTFLREGPQRFLVLLMLLAGLAGLGLGCTSTAALAPYGTPLGVSTLQVTASAYVNNAVVSQSVYFTVDVTAP